MTTTLHPDWLAFFESLIAARVDFVLVGGLAIGVHAEPRATDDLDVFVRPTLANARRLRRALQSFGFGAETPTAERLNTPNRVFMIGRKPLRIDVLNAIDGVTFAEAWRNRVQVEIDGVLVPVIGRAELIANKAASAREKDLFDLALLARAPATKFERAARAPRSAGRPRPPRRS